MFLISKLKSKIGIQMLLITIGKTLGFVISMLTNIVIIRQLGPAEYGIFAIGIAIILLLNGIIGEALDFGVQKYIPLYLQQDEMKARQSINATFQFKLFSGFLLLVISFTLSHYLSELLFKNSDLDGIIRLTVIGLIGTLIMKSVSAYFQSSERFKSFLLLDLSYTLLKFCCISVLIYVGALTASSSIFVYAMAPFIIFILFIREIPKGYLWGTRVDKDILLTVFHFSKWVVVSFGLSAVHSRLDILMLGFIRGSEDVGIYSAALNVAMTPEIIASFAAIVFYPKIMLFYNKGLFKDLFFKSFKYTIPFCISAIILALLLANTVISIFYTDQYNASTPILRILVIGYIFSWLIVPLASPFLFMLIPRFLVYVDLATLIFIFLGNTIMIPKYGAMGAALVSSIARIFIAVTIICVTTKIVNR